MAASNALLITTLWQEKQYHASRCRTPKVRYPGGAEVLLHTLSVRGARKVTRAPVLRAAARLARFLG